MGTWTLTELAALAARALADARVQVTSARVTGVPDGRLIRWYSTIGLLDRPAIGPDRFARYGMRHLLQLVAIKRLQAQGLPIAEIQARLAGATDAQLRRVAALPPGLTEAGPAKAEPPGAGLARSQGAGPEGDGAGPDRGTGHQEQFWARRPVAGPGTVDAAGDTVTRLYGLRLDGLTLLLPAEPARDDIDAIATAARPLLDVLHAHGLLDPTEGAPR